ncbi:tetratricopeptide repeat protein [sulfur-oxidizing endosymbiont of Gigantopelta aegis]|uniref:tetratricopeptide repeat protein n=1 Tax=sulfur-oxidizing endosymbiont of Gigantopelta aegis TaxID=2794934 RepID=UPI0018DEB0F2|nr:tetratricopeptide repeat protein [sulfur-oxidizing endosymbiont of Gigantopelta aegis]
MKYFDLPFSMFIFMFILVLPAQSIFANECTSLVQKEDYYEATDVCGNMAKKGNRDAQFALAVMYYQGSGMISDMGMAYKWMRKSAEKNHPQAQYNLGIMMANGQGSDVDLVGAYAWLKISADNAYSAANDSVKQLGEELSSKEKQAADEKIQSLKKEYNLK